MNMVEFAQTDTRMVPASQSLFEMIKTNRVIHDGDLTARRHIRSVVAKEKERGWRISKPDGSRKRVDFAIALAMATYLCVGVVSAHESSFNIYLNIMPIRSKVTEGKLRSILYTSTVKQPEKHYGYSFWCLGCDEFHSFVTDSSRKIHWEFNGDMESPTFTPSLGVHSDEYLRKETTDKYRCHLVVENGQIKYLTDCKHDYAGQTIDMVDWPNGE